MKALGRAMRSSAKPLSGVRAAAPVARRSRHAAHEAAATIAAGRFVQGEGRLAGNLGVAPAAALRVPGSQGAGLPVALRTRLESAFDADLGGVRVHTDAAAQAAAHGLQARAFAAGPHIYFASGHYAPGSPAGQELVAHEVAHVLQQTGRVASAGRVRTEAAEGAGDVQCDDDPNADSLVAFLAAEDASLQALTTRHAAAPGADDNLRALIGLVQAESGGKLARTKDSAIGKLLIRIAGDAGFDTPDAAGQPVRAALGMAASGFLLDCLKVCGDETHFAAAAKLLDADKTFELRSAFGPRTAFRAYLADMRGEDWVAPAFAHPALAKFWPGRFFNIVEQYMFNPGRGRQELYEFDAARNLALKNIDADTDDLLASDRVVLAFQLLDAFDQRRTAMMKVLDEVLEKRGATMSRPLQRLAAVQFMADWLRTREATAGSLIWGKTLARMRATATDAAAYWLAVSGLIDRTGADVNALGRDTLDGVSSKIKHVALTHETFAPLHELLQGLAAPGGLYGLDAAGLLGDSLPDAAGYEKRQRTLARALGVAASGNPANNLLLVLQTNLIAQYHATPALDSELAVGTGFAIWWLLQFQPTLLAYDAALDFDAKRGFADRRLAHRQRVASAVAHLSQMVGWGDTLSAAARLMRGNDVPASMLIVRDGWRLDESAELSQMATDFKNQSLSDDNPFTPDQIARFFHAETLRQTADAVMAQVDGVHQDPKRKLDADAVNKVIRAAARPWRCVPDGPMLVIKPSDVEAPAAGASKAVVAAAAARYPSAKKLIGGSPKSLAELRELAKLKHLETTYWWAALNAQTLPLFAWIYPDAGPLIAKLRGLDAFSKAVAGPDADKLSDVDWMKALMQKLDAGLLRKAIDSTLVDYASGEEAGLEMALREYTTVLRRERRVTVAGWLKRYAKDRSVVNFQVPRNAVDAIDWLRFEAQPQVDASAQQALLLLSLGDELEAAFPAVRNAVRLPPMFHATLTQAVAFCDSELAPADKGDTTFRRALTPLLFISEKDPAQNETFQHFLPHRDQLQALADRIEEGRLEIQESGGFGSEDGESLKSLGFYSTVKPGRQNAFEVDGDEWELVQVHQKFTYHPPLSLSAITDKSAKPILKDAQGRPGPIDHRLLASFLVNGLEFDLYADETAKLVKLSNALFNFGFQRSMENLAEGLEAGAMFLMDVIELVPGVGQELMLARLAAQTASFLGVELPVIADALRKDPVEFIKKIGVDLMEKYLTLDGFITFVMLGGSSPLDLLRRPTNDKQSTRNKPHGKLGRMLAMLRKIGMRIADAMQWLQLRVTRPVRSLQSSVATRPQLGWVLRKAVDIALWARDVLPPDALADAGSKQKRLLAVIEQLLPGDNALPEGGTDQDAEAFGRSLLARIEAEVSQAGGEFKAELGERLELLAQVELPGEIIPLPSLVGYVIDFFLSRLGAKVRIAKSLLENTGPYQALRTKVASAVGDEVRDTPLDPNKYWRENVLDKLEGRFADARNQLVDTLYGLTDQVSKETGVAAFRLDRPAAKAPGEMKLQRTPFPSDEIELAPSNAAPNVHADVPGGGRLAELPSAPGQPLAVRVRRSEEARFGHDFGHVRLHAGSASGEALRGMQADAATSGSHVFLRPGLDAERGEGARLLRHELTHVLQQTGARPLGQRHETRAVPGRPGVGVTLDAMREAAADAMARSDAQVAPGPLQVLAGAEGVQPSMESTAVHMLQLFTEIRSAGEFEHAADPKDKVGPAVASKLLLAVRKRLGQKLNSDFLPFAYPVAAHIVKHVDDTDLSADLPRLAAEAQKPVKGARGKKPRTELDFDRLVTFLEAVLFLKTGVAMQIKATAGAAPSVQSLRVTYIHLGWVLPGTPGKVPLWDEVLANSPKVIDGDDPKLVRKELFERLQTLGPDPFVWKTGTAAYRFSDDFAEGFAKWRATRKPEVIKNLPVKGAAPSASPTDIPKFKNEYLNPTGQSGIGLRIGLHGGHTGLEKQAGADRESHHMVQYLLVQFFRNDNNIKAWRSGVNYKGLKRVGGAITAYDGGSAGTLQLEALDKGGPGKRGSAMPAILIAADTHRRGQVHVEKESQWKGDAGDPDSGDAQGRATQSFAIRAEFQRQQAHHLGLHDDNPGWAAAVQRPDAQAKLQQAMVGTYGWMYQRMMGQLSTALQTRERAYYRAVAARLPNALDTSTGKLRAEYDLSGADIASVFARAKNHTDAVMASAGWTAA